MFISKIILTFAPQILGKNKKQMFILFIAALFFVCWLVDFRFEYVNDNNFVIYWTNPFTKQRHNYIF